MYLKFILVFILLFSSNAWAYKFHCNSEQTVCEIDSKRIVKGDRVGVFDSDGFLAAIGEVTAIKGQWREIKMVRKFQKISRDDRLDRIEDYEAKDPSRYFKIKQGMSAKSLGLQAGLLSVAAGAGIMAFEAEGFMQWLWKDNAYFVARGLFCRGSGRATINDGFLKQYTISMQAMGVTGGMAFNFLSGEMLTLRGELGLGLVNNSVSTNGDVDAKVLANGRIFSGMGMLMNSNVAAIVNFNSWNMLLAGEFLRLQNSNDFSISMGFVSAI